LIFNAFSCPISQSKKLGSGEKIKKLWMQVPSPCHLFQCTFDGYKYLWYNIGQVAGIGISKIPFQTSQMVSLRAGGWI